MPDLYPSFDVSEEMTEEIDETPEVPQPLITPFFDFKQMKIVTEPDGRVREAVDHEAFKQWVIRCVMTERYEYAAYSDDLGVEIKAIIRENYPRDIAESEIQRTIIEAITVDPRTGGVGSFSFEWNADNVTVRFEVESIYGRDEYVAEIGGEGVETVRVT